MKKSCVFLTVLSLVCICFGRHSWASGGYYFQRKTQVVIDSQFHTSRLKEVTERCMQHDANRKKRGVKTKVGRAILSEHRQDITDLIEKGADPNITFYFTDPCSGERERWSLVEIAAAHNRKKFLTFLLKQGANPNGVGNGSSPLQRAVDAGSLGSAELLLKWGADVKEELLFRLAEHDYCLRAYFEKPGLVVAMVELLTRYGADPRSRNRRLQTPADVAQAKMSYDNNNPKSNRFKKCLIDHLRKKERDACRARLTFLNS